MLMFLKYMYYNLSLLALTFQVSRKRKCMLILWEEEEENNKNIHFVLPNKSILPECLEVKISIIGCFRWWWTALGWSMWSYVKIGSQLDRLPLSPLN